MSLRQQSLKSKYFSKRVASSSNSPTSDANNFPDDVEGGDDSSIDEPFEGDVYRKRSQRGILAVLISFKNYILIFIVIILGISYLHERGLRFQIMEELNEKMSEKTFEDVYKTNSHKQAANTIVACPKCPQCSNDDTPEVSEQEEVPEVNPADNVKIWDDKHLVLTSEIQRLSKTLLQLKFGSPPYFVEFELEVDSETVKGGKFTIEMAPIDIMPYSTYFFLTQVAAGVWNSCSFFINLGVVYYDEARGSDRCNKEEFSRIDGIGETMAFQEYSDKYMHLTDTLGINGRPAGKGLYVNAQNNTRTLHPKGQRVVGGLPLEGDPCIGKIVRGLDSFQAIKRLEHLNDEGEMQLLSPDITAFQKAVTIISAKIVKDIDGQ